MLEKQRLHYLETFGVENYVSRKQLQNAAPSRLLSDELLMEPEAFSTEDQPSVPDPVNLAAQTTQIVPENTLQDMLNSAVQEKKAEINEASLNAEKTEKLATEKTLSKNTSAIAALKFSLNVWRVQDLLVLDSRQPGTALPTDRLLQNMLRSVGYKVAQLPKSELLNWPFSTQMRNNDPVAEIDEARAMVHAFMAAQCQREPVKAIWLLGENATKFGLSLEDLTVEDGEIFEKLQGSSVPQHVWGSQALIMPSLHDMLHEPLKKKMAWQAMQCLLSK